MDWFSAANLVALSMAARLVLRIDYRAADGQVTRRDIEVRDIHGPCCRAWCHLRGEMRTFRLDRIAAATLLDDPFLPDSPLNEVGNWRGAAPPA